MKQNRRLAMAGTFVTLAAPLLLGAGAALAQDYPVRPVRIVVPFSAGGGTDAVARTLAERAAEAWKQPVVIENRPGANGMIAAAYVAAAPKDGYTLLFTINSFVLSTMLYQKPSYRLSEFVPVTTVGSAYMVLFANRDIPGGNGREVLNSLKDRPHTYGTFGLGSLSHLYGELLARSRKLELLHVPYKGEVDVVAGMMGGQIDSTFLGPRVTTQLLSNGKVQVIAVAAPKRIESLPDAPTFSELGLPGLDRGTFMGLLAPAGTPTSVIRRWEAVSAEALRNPDFKARLKANGLEVPEGHSAESFATVLRDDQAFWGPLIKSLDLKLD